MIIECINCNKKFSVDSNLIPESGRTIQCGSCNHVWFFKREFGLDNLKLKDEIQVKKYTEEEKVPLENTKQIKKQKKLTSLDKDRSLVKYEKKSNYSISKILSLLVVLIITFIAFIIILDTFKLQLEIFFPNLEFILYNLYETLKDIFLFTKDLI